MADSEDFQLELVNVPRAELSVPTRYVMTPFPQRDEMGRQEYTREFTRGGNRKLILKTLMPAEVQKEFGGMDTIPTGAIGRNVHAALLQDVLRIYNRDGGSEVYPVIYESFRLLADRTRVTAQSKNYEKIDQLLTRLSWLTLLYFENGRVMNVIADAAVYREQGGVTLVAKNYRREKSHGNGYRFQIDVTDDYRQTMGAHLQYVDEETYMQFQSSFAKDFYAWLVYASNYAKVRSQKAFEVPMKDLVKQLGEQGTVLNRGNESHYVRKIREAINEIRKRDTTIDADVESGIVRARARTELQSGALEGTVPVTAPTIGEATAEFEKMMSDLKANSNTK